MPALSNLKGEQRVHTHDRGGNVGPSGPAAQPAEVVLGHPGENSSQKAGSLEV